MYKKIILLLCCSFLMGIELLGCGKEEDPQKYINLGNYREIELEGVPTSGVSEEEINDYIDEIRLRNAEEIEVVGEPAKEGDLVYIDFTAKIEENLEEISEKDCMITIGMSEISEGLDKSVIGHVSGDVYEFTGRISNDYYNVDAYYNEEVAGENVIFTITVKSIHRLKLPELNDEFIMLVSEKSKTVDEYRKEVERLLEEDGIKEINAKIEIWNAVVEDTKVKKYPEKELQNYIQKQENYYKKMAKECGMTYQEFVENEMGSSQEDFQKRIEKEAKGKLKEDLVAKAIAKKENLEIDSKNKMLLETVKSWLVENCKIHS